jgi:peroxiredoxin
MTLKESIDSFMEGVSRRAPPEVLAGLRAEIEKLAASGVARRALAVGDEAPDFTLPDAHGSAVTLSSVLAAGPAIVAFYRGGWCPFCDLQLRAYQGVLADIHALGAELVAVSPQTPDYALSDVEKRALTFPVLSDVGNRVARDFKLVFALSEELQRLQTGLGGELPKFNGDASWELPLPGTFVIDRRRVILFASVDADWTTRVEPAALLDVLRALPRERPV